jgi:hypothetical protein
MATPANILQNVQTYQNAELAWMLNSFAAIATSNKRFKNFQDKPAQLGDTVNFELAYRATTGNGLVISEQATQMRLQSLACVQAAYTSAAYTDQQFLFNVKDYMNEIGKSRILELGTTIESDVLLNFVSGVTVNNPQDPRFGQIIDPASGPYRFFGDGVTNINSFNQLAQACANFRAYGAAKEDMCGFLPVTVEPQIVASGLNQFATSRNNEIATSWMVGDFSQTDWYRSNLLPTHYAGTVGNSAQVLTLVSTNDPTGNNITQLTFSGATNNDPNAIMNGDMMSFNYGVSGFPDMHYLTFIGHKPTSLPVQFRATESVGANSSGHVTFDIYPPLQSTPGPNQNLNNALQPGMQVTVLPTHVAGIIMSGNPLYMAMPRLPDETPFPTVQTTDEESGASIRHYWGSQFGQNNRAYVWDQIWGSTLVAENSMRLIFTLS